MMAEHEIPQASHVLCTALAEARCPVVVVSNEVGQGITPDNAMARAFVIYQGRLNQALAKVAQEVYFVTAGLPQQLKGGL